MKLKIVLVDLNRINATKMSVFKSWKSQPKFNIGKMIIPCLEFNYETRG